MIRPARRAGRNRVPEPPGLPGSVSPLVASRHGAEPPRAACREATVFIALLRLELRLHGAASLKDKRSVVKRLVADLRRLNCAVAEVEHQELRQRATLAVATVANEHYHARRVLHEAERAVERNHGVELLGTVVSVYGPEDG